MSMPHSPDIKKPPREGDLKKFMGKETIPGDINNAPSRLEKLVEMGFSVRDIQNFDPEIIETIKKIVDM